MWFIKKSSTSYTRGEIGFPTNGFTSNNSRIGEWTVIYNDNGTLKPYGAFYSYEQARAVLVDIKSAVNIDNVMNNYYETIAHNNYQLYPKWVEGINAR